MKYKINYTDGNVLKGELDGVPTDIKILGNEADKFVVQIGDKVGTMKVVYTSVPNIFEVEALNLPEEQQEDDGSSSDDSGSSADDSGSSADEGSSADVT